MNRSECGFCGGTGLQNPGPGVQTPCCNCSVPVEDQIIVLNLKSLISEYENDIKCIEIEASTKRKIMTRKKNMVQDILESLIEKGGIIK